MFTILSLKSSVQLSTDYPYKETCPIMHCGWAEVVVSYLLLIVIIIEVDGGCLVCFSLL